MRRMRRPTAIPIQFWAEDTSAGARCGAQLGPRHLPDLFILAAGARATARLGDRGQDLVGGRVVAFGEVEPDLVAALEIERAVPSQRRAQIEPAVEQLSEDGERFVATAVHELERRER